MKILPLVLTILLGLCTTSCKTKKDAVTNGRNRIIVHLKPKIDPQFIVTNYKHLSILLIGPSSKIENKFLFAYDDSNLKEDEDILDLLNARSEVISVVHSKVLKQPRVDINYKQKK